MLETTTLNPKISIRTSTGEMQGGKAVFATKVYDNLKQGKDDSDYFSFAQAVADLQKGIPTEIVLINSTQMREV